MGLPNEASRNEKQTKRNPNSLNTEEMAKEHPWEMNIIEELVLATGRKKIGKREVFH